MDDQDYALKRLYRSFIS